MTPLMEECEAILALAVDMALVDLIPPAACKFCTPTSRCWFCKSWCNPCLPRNEESKS